ncbi:MAG: hypothetical protein Q4E94_05800 [Clostridia bacterium]|nr:hypothetical protein [Clostridia bacterium]
MKREDIKAIFGEATEEQINAVMKLNGADAARLEKLKERYNAAAVDKDGKPLEWAHDAIRDSYMQRFVEEVQKDENSGRSDADIFNALTKDDGGAFKTASAQTVFGGAGKASGGGSVLDDIYKDNPFYKGKKGGILQWEFYTEILT